MPTTSQPAYRPIGGNARASFAIAVAAAERLYLGEDHLLYVRNEGFTESYRRFFFRDIQALVVAENGRRRLYTWPLLVLSGGCALVSWAIGSATFADWGWIVLAGFAALFGAFLLANAALGPTCDFYIQTAVQTCRVNSIRRLRAARKALAVIQPLLIEAQGGVLAETAMPAFAPAASPAPPTESRPTPTPKPLRHEEGRFHEALFYLLLVDAVATVADIFVKSVGLTLLEVGVGVGTIGLLVGALVKQTDSDVSNAVRRVVWGTLAYIGVFLIIGTLQYTLEGIQTPGQTRTQWEMLEQLAAESVLDSPFRLITYTVSATTAAVLGLLGLVSLREHRARTERLPPPEGSLPPTRSQPVDAGAPESASRGGSAPNPPPS